MSQRLHRHRKSEKSAKKALTAGACHSKLLTENLDRSKERLFPKEAEGETSDLALTIIGRTIRIRKGVLAERLF